jgi:glutathione S-transferase
MKLHYTPKSHFARKDRILIDALGLDVELIDAGNVAVTDQAQFAGNPLMKVPTLITDQGQVVFESDPIAEYLVRTFDPEDRFAVLTTDLDTRNARSVMNGVMAADVELVMAERTGIDAGKYQRYDKFLSTIHQGLGWLQQRPELFTGATDYSAFHLVSLWDHLLLYDLFELSYPQLESWVKQHSAADFVSRSTPL